MKIVSGKKWKLCYMNVIGLDRTQFAQLGGSTLHETHEIKLYSCGDTCFNSTA